MCSYYLAGYHKEITNAGNRFREMPNVRRVASGGRVQGNGTGAVVPLPSLWALGKNYKSAKAVPSGPA